jgi:hypothetical protein
MVSRMPDNTNDKKIHQITMRVPPGYRALAEAVAADMGAKARKPVDLTAASRKMFVDGLLAEAKKRGIDAAEYGVTPETIEQAAAPAKARRAR